MSTRAGRYVTQPEELAKVLETHGGNLAAASNASTQIHTIDGKDLCRVHDKPSRFPVEAMIH